MPCWLKNIINNTSTTVLRGSEADLRCNAMGTHAIAAVGKALAGDVTFLIAIATATDTSINTEFEDRLAHAGARADKIFVQVQDRARGAGEQLTKTHDMATELPSRL